MSTFTRSVQAYLLMLAFIGALAAIWGTNWFVLDNTTAGTGWPLMVAIAVALVMFGVVIRRRAAAETDPTREQYPWSSRR